VEKTSSFPFGARESRERPRVLLARAGAFIAGVEAYSHGRRGQELARPTIWSGTVGW